MESDSAKSAKFSIVRKLCQPGVYVLVSVVASLYVIVVIVFMTCRSLKAVERYFERCGTLFWELRDTFVTPTHS